LPNDYERQWEKAAAEANGEFTGEQFLRNKLTNTIGQEPVRRAGVAPFSATVYIVRFISQPRPQAVETFQDQK